MKDYRQFYKNKTGIDFDSKKYEVHHIDLNRENNDISNLVLLPIELHRKYHYYLEQVNFNAKFSPKIQSITESGHKHNKKHFEDISNFLSIQLECNKWADYREYLLGNLPNIHNIHLGGF